MMWDNGTTYIVVLSEPIRGAMDKESDLSSLVNILKLAYSGELAAAYAYRGHWKSLKNPSEIARIKQIEDEEWAHRQNIARMMEFMEIRPSALRDVRCWIVGRSIGIACHLMGWFLPMYFAGRLESGNTIEYEHAAMHAGRLGLLDFESELQVMARVEKEHEQFFLGVISNHAWLPFVSRIFKWGGASRIGASPIGTSPIAASRAAVSPIAPNPIASDGVQEIPAGSAANVHPERTP
jgi:demethoxyubiquinone hydroxylase (CLK1/Coq7/Cat5 family)